MAAFSIPEGTKIMCALCGQDITMASHGRCQVNCRSGGEDGTVTLVCIDCWNKPGLLVEAEIDEDFATDCLACGMLVERPAGTVCEECDDFRCDYCHAHHDCPRTFGGEASDQPAVSRGASAVADLGPHGCRAGGIEAAEMWSAVVAGDVGLDPDDPRGLWDEPPLVPWRETPAVQEGNLDGDNR